MAKQTPADEIYKNIQEDVFNGNCEEIKLHVQGMISKGIKAEDILQKGMIKTMEVIGEKFKAGEVFIPEALLSARVMNEALSVLEPYLVSTQHGNIGKVLIETVLGDYHDIGKNIVMNMLRGVGFEVRDLGINVPTEEFVKQVKEYQPDLVALSALLTTTLPEMKK
jgi:5-methyltetrahydrofolate--homocysteine methyltransferase